MIQQFERRLSPLKILFVNIEATEWNADIVMRFSWNASSLSPFFMFVSHLCSRLRRNEPGQVVIFWEARIRKAFDSQSSIYCGTKKLCTQLNNIIIPIPIYYIYECTCNGIMMLLPPLTIICVRNVWINKNDERRHYPCNKCSIQPILPHSRFMRMQPHQSAHLSRSSAMIRPVVYSYMRVPLGRHILARMQQNSPPLLQSRTRHTRIGTSFFIVLFIVCEKRILTTETESRGNHWSIKIELE